MRSRQIAAMLTRFVTSGRYKNNTELYDIIKKGAYASKYGCPTGGMWGVSFSKLLPIARSLAEKNDETCARCGSILINDGCPYCCGDPDCEICV